LWNGSRRRLGATLFGMGVKTRRVLIYRLGSLGDMLVALPALHLVARAFPEAERRMLTNIPVNAKAPPAAAILEGSGLVQGYMRYAVGTRSVGELARLWWAIVRWRPEVLVYLGPTRGVQAAKRDAAFFRLCGIRRLVGVPETEGMQRNFYGAGTGGKDQAMGDGNLEPEAARLARNIGALGAVGEVADPARLNDAASWDLHLSQVERETAAAAIGAEALELRPIAVSVGTKVQAKDWGRENWRALLAEMAAGFPGRALLLAGAPEESEASEFAAAGWSERGGGPVVNLCGKLTPRESAAAFARAEIFVGHDSGPMHLAASVGTPVVAIFAARNIPRQWFPFGRQHRVVYHRVECWGCGLETCVEQRKKCLLSITVDEVLVEVRAALSQDVSTMLRRG
jgi:heptosyltransferase-3